MMRKPSLVLGAANFWFCLYWASDIGDAVMGKASSGLITLDFRRVFRGFHSAYCPTTSLTITTKTTKEDA